MISLTYSLNYLILITHELLYRDYNIWANKVLCGWHQAMNSFSKFFVKYAEIK